MLLFSSEADRHREFAAVRRAKFQHSAIRRLITLLVEEFWGGAATGKLYADSLALAIGMRYVHLCLTRCFGGDVIYRLHRLRSELYIVNEKS
jgi:hypothetical protein